jgi:hypothetical protein
MEQVDWGRLLQDVNRLKRVLCNMCDDSSDPMAQAQLTLKISETQKFRLFNFPENHSSHTLFKVLAIYCYSDANQVRKVKEDLVQFIRKG